MISCSMDRRFFSTKVDYCRWWFFSRLKLIRFRFSNSSSVYNDNWLTSKKKECVQLVSAVIIILCRMNNEHRTWFSYLPSCMRKNIRICRFGKRLKPILTENRNIAYAYRIAPIHHTHGPQAIPETNMSTYCIAQLAINSLYKMQNANNVQLCSFPKRRRQWNCYAYDGIGKCSSLHAVDVKRYA